MKRQAEEILTELGVDIPGDRLIKQLPVAAQQMVEIAKAFSLNASLILMDEPTSALVQQRGGCAVRLDTAG